MRAWAVLAVGAIMYASSVVWAATRLPETGVPRHFTAHGIANRVGARGEAVHEWIWLGVMMLGLSVGVILIVRLGPLSLANLPYKSYWMTEQRQAILRGMLATDLAVVMCLTLLYLALIPQWVVSAARAVPKALPPVMVWGPFGLYLLLVVLWLGWRFLTSYRPPH
jgi:hypothetical protein